MQPDVFDRHDDDAFNVDDAVDNHAVDRNDVDAVVDDVAERHGFRVGHDVVDRRRDRADEPGQRHVGSKRRRHGQGRVGRRQPALIGNGSRARAQARLRLRDVAGRRDRRCRGVQR